VIQQAGIILPWDTTNTTGLGNVFIGNNAGYTIETGSNNVFIGNGPTPFSTSCEGSIVIGGENILQITNSTLL